MIRRRSIVTFLAGAAVVSLALTACGGGGNNSSSAGTTTRPVTQGGTAASVGVADSDLGKILVDSKGRTLYLFLKDSGTTSNCSGNCATFWPPLVVTGTPTVGSGAKASLVGTTMRSDGKSQVTYNGHPVYLYTGDQKPGDTTGEGVVAFGAGWYALSSAGTQVSGQASSSGGSSTSSGY